MKDYKIYIFQVTGYNTRDMSIAQIYAEDFYIAWDLIVFLNPGFEDIDFIGFEYTTMPEFWEDESSFVCENN